MKEPDKKQVDFFAWMADMPEPPSLQEVTNAISAAIGGPPMVAVDMSQQRQSTTGTAHPCISCGKPLFPKPGVLCYWCGKRSA